MPKGVYKRTLEHNRKVSESKKGHPGYGKGEKRSKEFCERVSKSLKGKKKSEDHKKKLEHTYFKKGIIPWNKGRKCPYISGENNPMYGKTHTDESKAKISKIHKGKIIPKDIRIKMGSDGEKNGNWKGGISYEPYCEVWNDIEYKTSIKERDNYKCKHPDCWENSKILVIHHINYIKKDCSPKNLITLCNSCNSRVNNDREKWMKYFEEILAE
jgi:hypothetical protein